MSDARDPAGNGAPPEPPLMTEEEFFKRKYNQAATLDYAAITNQVFLQIVFGQASGNIWLCSFKQPPDSNAPWGGIACNLDDPVTLPSNQNTYFSVAELKNRERKISSFLRMAVAVLDDADITALPIAPSYIIETSPGKYQVGLVLNDTSESRDPEYCKRALQGLISRGFVAADKSGNNIVRYVRLPVGTNTKLRASGPFQHILKVWEPSRRYDFPDVLAALDVSISTNSAAPVAAQFLIGDDRLDVKQAMEEIITGTNFHDNLTRLAARYAAKGQTHQDIEAFLTAVIDSSSARTTDLERWKSRRAEIPKAVASACLKFSAEEAEGNNSQMEVLCMDDVEMKKVNWLWPDRIARGKITVIAGDPGLGKSQITAALAAVVSKPLSWPDSDAFADAGNVIILSAEDDPSDTIKPRLIAAGADLKRCHVIKAIREKKNGKTGERTFDLTQDVQRLGAAIEKIGNVGMCIIDPISAYLGQTDSNNNSDMRGLLAPLSAMAAEFDVAIILVTHLNKSKDDAALMRVIGSIGLIAAARAGFLVMKDKEKPDIRYFLPIKNNLGNDREGFSFHIQSVTLPEGIKTSKICWHEGTVDAHRILNPEPKSETNGAREFLKNLLSGKTLPVDDVIREGDGAGYSKSAMQRAANRLHVTRRKDGLKGSWLWSLQKNNTLANDEDAEDDASEW